MTQLFSDLMPGGDSKQTTGTDLFGDLKPKYGVGRKAADIGLEFGGGVALGAQSIANVFGAGSDTSRKLSKAAEYATGLQSPQRRAEKQRHAQRMQEAEESGSTLSEIGAAVRNFGEAPVSTTAGALGSTLPTLAAAAVNPGLALPVGVAQGVGIVKGEIHEDVERRLIESGVDAPQAAQRARLAQAYFGENMDQIALGGGLGLLAGRFGVERAITGLGREGAGTLLGRTTAGAISEGVTEAAQGGQERLAANVASQREGFEDIPTWQGVAGQATLEGLAGAALGGSMSAATGRQRDEPPGTEGETAGSAPASPETLALPAPVYTGTPGAQITEADVARANSLAEAESRTTDLQRRRAEFEAQRMGINPADGPVSRAATKAVEETLALPAPGMSSAPMTGIPSHVALLAEVERANASSEAEARTQELYRRRAQFEEESAQRRLTAFTEKGAQRAAQQLAQERGEAHQVIPHPTVEGRFAAVPTVSDAPTTQAGPLPENPAASATAPAGVELATLARRGSAMAQAAKLRKQFPDAQIEVEQRGDRWAVVDRVENPFANSPGAMASTAMNRLAELQGMASEAGWQERGGLMLRAEGAEGEVTGRTAWIPSAEWFAGKPQGVTEHHMRSAVEKVARGEAKLTKPERQGLEYMLDTLADFDRQTAQAQNEGDARIAELEAEVEALASLVDEGAVEALRERLAMQMEDATQEDYLRALTEALNETVAQAGRDRSAQENDAGGPAVRDSEAGREDRAEAPAQPEQGEAGGQPELLSGYTEADLAQREAAQQAATEQEAAAEREAQRREQADAERDTFTLTGSDRAADVQAAQGQGGLFDAPAQSDAGIADVRAAIEKAEQNTHTSPTEGQKEAGNYAKGKVDLHGQTISIETPKGAQRSGTDANGNRWSVRMPVSYGYFLGTKANDGDHVDVFVGPRPEAGMFWVVNQTKPDSNRYDEPKVMLGFDGAEQARQAYIGSFSEGFGDKVFGNMVGPFSVADMGAMVDRMGRDAPVRGDVAVEGRGVAEPNQAARAAGGQAAKALKEVHAAGRRAVQTEPSQTAESDAITDLGEKIGGARKDTATSTGARKSTATTDDRPAWARRFEISQVVSEGREKDKWNIHDTRSKNAFGHARRVGGPYDTREEAEAAIPIVAVALKHRAVNVGRGDDVKYEIWRDVTDRKRVKVVDRTFETREEALKYMAEHAAEIIEANTTFGEADLPVPKNKRRVGVARREGDVKGDDFMETFGFRGVEFGNWNNQAERQELMNEAYDGLLDLAEVMNIPAKAISLNGDLALAFGARGHGLRSSRAHYERDKAVINLTKMNGAGALAHEWFHALDHYFGRQDGKAPSEWKTDKDGTRSLLVRGEESDMASGGFSYGDRSGVRPEVRDAYDALMDTIFRKAEQYVEDTERADKFVNAAKFEVQHALDSIRRELAEQKDPRYWKRNNKPAPAEVLAEFDTLAQQIVEGFAVETAYTRIDGSKSRSALGSYRYTNDTVERISQIYKKVRGRSGFTSDQGGTLNSLVRIMNRYSQRLKMLADAQKGDQKTKKVPTEFAMDAKSLDQGRGTNYWTTPHEMAARAFQGYVEDKIAAGEGRSPFLNYGPENAVIETPWGWKRPYPAGKERKAINAALDTLVETLETRVTEKGVALFSFAGRNAAIADTLALDGARKQIAAGADAETVRQETGWFKGADGKWRFEISDDAASLAHGGETFEQIHAAATLDAMTDGREGVRVGDMLDHPALFAAYPSLADVTVETMPSSGKGRARISVRGGKATIYIRPTMKREAALSALLHELQHGIQAVEGFATGGTADAAGTVISDRKPIIEAYGNFASEIGKFGVGFDALPDLDALLVDFDSAIDSLLDMIPRDIVRSRNMNAVEQAADALRRAVDENTLSPYEQYRRLAGEVESRNTQTRQRMSAEQRRQVSPDLTADVSASDVIVAMNGKEMHDAPAPANAGMRQTGEPGLTEAGLVEAMSNQFPKLADAVRTMLERGRRGEKGGAVLIESAAGRDIAAEFASRTGREFSDTIEMFRAKNGAIQGFFDPQSGLTFLVGPSLDATSGPAVLLHEMVHGQQRAKVDESAMEMIQNRAKAPRAERRLLDRVAQRMEEAGEAGNAKEAAAYIVEEAVLRGRAAGFTAADSKLAAWIDVNISKRIGDLVRSFIRMVRQWGMRHSVRVGEITIDDMVSYAMAGVERAAQGNVQTSGSDGTMRRMSERDRVASEQAPDPAGDGMTGGAMPWPLSGKEPLVVFHNTEEGDGFYVRDDFGFGGIFAGPRGGMHGSKTHAIILDPDSVMSHADFKHAVAWENYLAALQSEIPHATEEDAHALYDFISEDRDSGDIESEVDYSRLFRGYPMNDDPGWAIQALRGKIAARLGYQAAEMKDETGRSYFIAPGVRTFPLLDGETMSAAEARIYESWKTSRNESSSPADSGDVKFSMAPAIPGARQAPRTADAFPELSDAQRQFLNKVGTPPTTQRVKDWVRARTDRIGTKIRQGLVDRYAALKELDEKLLGRDFINTAITDSSWVLARMSSSASGALSAMMTAGRIRFDAKERVISMQDGEPTGGLTELLKQVGTPAEVERFFAWMAANRAEKLMAEGREHLFTAEDIAAGKQLNTGKTEDGRSRAMTYAKAHAEFQKYRDDVLAIGEATGIISAENRAMWKDEFYVPFYRVMAEEDGANGPRAGKGLSRQEAYKKLKGGRENLNDLLENTLMNFHHLLSASLKNQAASQAIRNAERLGIAQKVSESKRDPKTSTFVLEDGKRVFYQVDDPLVFESLTALSDPGLNNFAVKTMGAFKRLLTNMVTVTPQFIVANTMRDLMQATATTPTSKNVFRNAYQGVRGFRDPKTNAEMLASGGAFSFGHVWGTDMDEVRASLPATLRGAGVITDMKMIPALLRKGWAAWNDVANTSENTARAATYLQNVEQHGKLYAAYEARDIMDFSQHGAWPAIRFLIRTVPFLNARMQGLDKIYRSGLKPAVLTAMGKGSTADKQAAARFGTVTGALTLATIALYLANRDDDEYRKLEDWQKDTYWFFRVGDNAFFLPKPFEVGAIATMAERVAEQFLDDKATGALFGERMKDMLMQTFAFNPVPQMFQPALDVYSNRDAFTGRPIETPGMDRLSVGMRARDTTTAAARGISAASRVLGDESPIALSPVQADHLIRGYFGTVGANAAGIMDTIWRAASGQESPDKRWSEYQPIKRFYRDLGAPPPYTRYSTLFYDGLREANRVYADVRELQALGRQSEAAQLAAEQRDMLVLRKTLNAQQRRLSEINARIKMVRRSDNDGAWKRRELDRLNAMKGAITENVGKRIEMVRAAG